MGQERDAAVNPPPKRRKTSWATARRRSVWRAETAYGLGALESRVLESLCEVCPREQWPTVFRSRADISSDTGLSEEQVSNAIRRLKLKGILTLVKAGHRPRGGQRLGSASVYTVNVSVDYDDEAQEVGAAPAPAAGGEAPRGRGRAPEPEGIDEAFGNLCKFAEADGVPIGGREEARGKLARLVASPRYGYSLDEICAPRTGLYARVTNGIMERNAGDRSSIPKYLKGRTLEGWLDGLFAVESRRRR